MNNTMICCGKTDQGSARNSNQDTFHIYDLDEQTILMIVCDGMGGANGGDVASSMAAEQIGAYVAQDYQKEMGPESLTPVLRTAFGKTNMNIFERGKKDETLFGMGTTAVAAIARESFAVIANIGDSRAYLLDGLDIIQISKDHSMVQELLDVGNLTQTEAKTHPKKNIITRALGIGPRCEIDLYEVALSKGNHIVLCSDGLSNMVDEKEIAFEFSGELPMETQLKHLIDMANDRGGVDNITVTALLV